MDTIDTSAIKFAEFIKLKKSQKKLKVKELASKAGLSTAFVYMVQDRLSQPSISSATRILEALGESWTSFEEYMKDVA